MARSIVLGFVDLIGAISCFTRIILRILKYIVFLQQDPEHGLGPLLC